jgi:hypothetical protein
MAKAEAFLDHIRKTKSKITYANYKQGLNKYLIWENKSADEILEQHKANLQSDDPRIKGYYKDRLEEFWRAMVARSIDR